jgi:hypothetical protein
MFILWPAFAICAAKLDVNNGYQEYKSRAASQRYEAAQDIADECGNPASAIDAIRECLLEHILSYQEEETRDTYLVAQQDMVLFWVKLMFHVTVIGVPISISGF